MAARIQHRSMRRFAHPQERTRLSVADSPHRLAVLPHNAVEAFIPERMRKGGAAAFTAALQILLQPRQRCPAAKSGNTGDK